MERKALKRVAVQLNRGAVRGSSARLAAVMGVSLPTVRGWLTDPTHEANHRRMTRGARRLLATMALLDGAGLLDDKFIAAVDTFDRLLNEGDIRLDQAMEKLKTISEGDNGEGDEDE